MLLVGFFFIPEISHAETDIDGLYYLRNTSDILHWHGIRNNDTGFIQRNAPTHHEGTWCGGYVLFMFDEAGTYTQTNHLSNVYYHVWWYSDNAEGQLGYSPAGLAGDVADYPFDVNVSNSKAIVNGYYLYAGKQTADYDFEGEDIYLFTVVLKATATVILPSPSHPSFIILNLPDDETLELQDSDSDTINDYDELFTYYTNPYDTDTDDDSFSDSEEITNSTNPNDPDVSPAFGRALLKEFYGSAELERLSTAVSRIVDRDGDGKEDIIISKSGWVGIYSASTGNLLTPINGSSSDSFGCRVVVLQNSDETENIAIGASWADPGGRTDAGCVYIYSSAGDYIRQIDGAVAGEQWGSAITPIGDQDGDGNEDIIIGAPNADPLGKTNAGKVYIYSSTGSQLQSIDGTTAGDAFGWSVSRVADQDSDEKEDVIAGAPNADPGGISAAGSAYIYSSSTANLIQQFNGTNTNDNFGYSVAAINNGNGTANIAIGAPGASPNGKTRAGKVCLYSPAGTLIQTINGTVGLLEFGGTVGSGYGQFISSIGDQDGDGNEDIIIGAPDISYNERVYSGAAYIYSSSTGNLLREIAGSFPRDQWSCWAVAPIGDQDGDGKEDMIVGSTYVNHNDIRDVGAVKIYSSCAGIPVQTWPKNTTKLEAFDLDDYFSDPNNTTTPSPNQTITYTASILDNFYIYVFIDGENKVSFLPMAGWAGTETVVFTARDSTGLSSQSNIVTLTVIGEAEVFENEEINKKDCFIATAAYGTSMAEEVQILRKFRNEYLLSNPLGRAFVQVYYKISPTVAEFIRENALLRTIVRKTLVPLIWINEKAKE